jgi:hypothetical protein
LSLFLLTLNLSEPNIHVFDFWLEDAVVALLYPAVGAFVVTRRPKNLVAWLLCFFGLLGGLRHLFSQCAIYALQAEPGSFSGGEVFAWAAHFLWTPYQGLIVFTALLFPNGRLPSARWRWVAWSTGVGILVGTIAVSFSSIPYTGLGHIHNPAGIWGAGTSHAVECLCVVFLLVASTALLARLRGAPHIERQQITWVVYAGTVLIVGDFLKYVLFFTFDVSWALWPGFALLTAGLIGVPVAMGIAILRYRLYEIDLIINRTLVYGSLTATLGLVYFGGVTATQALFHTITDRQELPQLVIVASTLAIAALFNPLRRGVQAFVDRRFYRRKYDARKTLETFSSKLRDETDLEALNGELVGVVSEAMQPAHVSLWLRPPTEARGSGRPSA